MKRSMLHMLLALFAIAVAVGAGVGAYLAFRPPSTDYEPATPAAPESAPLTVEPQPSTRQEPEYVPPKPRAVAVVSEPRRESTRPAKAEVPGADMDPQEVLSLIENILTDSSQEEQRKLLTELGKVLAARDFDLAMKLAMSIEDGRTRGALLRGILFARGAVDPQTALLAAFDLQPILAEGEMPSSDYRYKDMAFRYALSAALSGWASTDPQGALEYANEQLADRHRGQALNAVYASWAASDPEAAMASAAGLDGRLQQDAMHSIYHEWAVNDPAAAIVYASENLEEGRTKHETVGTILRQWASDNLADAVTWVEQTTENREQAADTLRHIAYGLASREPARAAELLDLYPELVSSRGLTSRLVGEWARSDPASAAAWSETIPDASLRGQAIKTTAGNWASLDYDQAYTWAQGLPDDKSRAFALSNVAIRQAQEGMEQSTAWIQNLPTGFVRDRTVAGYGLGALRQNRDYQSARLLQNEIGDDAVDMQKVGAIIQASRIPEDEKARLRNMY